MTPTYSRTFLAVAAATFALAGCGGGGGSPLATEQVPDSASASSAGFMAYLKDLVASPADTLEPVATSMVSPPPADDKSEPGAVE